MEVFLKIKNTMTELSKRSLYFFISLFYFLSEQNNKTH